MVAAAVPRERDTSLEAGKVPCQYRGTEHGAPDLFARLLAFGTRASVCPWEHGHERFPWRRQFDRSKILEISRERNFVPARRHFGLGLGRRLAMAIGRSRLGGAGAPDNG